MTLKVLIARTLRKVITVLAFFAYVLFMVILVGAKVMKRLSDWVERNASQKGGKRA